MLEFIQATIDDPSDDTPFLLEVNAQFKNGVSHFIFIESIRQQQLFLAACMEGMNKVQGEICAPQGIGLIFNEPFMPGCSRAYSKEALAGNGGNHPAQDMDRLFKIAGIDKPLRGIPLSKLDRTTRILVEMITLIHLGRQTVLFSGLCEQEIGEVGAAISRLAENCDIAALILSEKRSLAAHSGHIWQVKSPNLLFIR